MPRPPPRCWRSAPKPCAGNTCPTEESRAGTGAPATRAARRGARCSSGLRRRARRASGPMRPPASTATCSTSSGSPPVPARCARRSPRRARFLAHPVPPASSRSDAYDRTDAARNLWNRCGPIDGTHAEAYLRARAIHRCRFPALRFHPSLPYRPDAGGWRRLPALVAAVTGDNGELEGMHRTWLDPKRPAKARVSRPRKALGHVHGLAVRFGEPGAASTLLVGEGIETVLSLVSALPDTVAAAALSAGSLGAFAPPHRVSRLIIACDRGEHGEFAARRLPIALHRARYRHRGADARGQRLQRRPRHARTRPPRQSSGAADRPASPAQSERLRRCSRNEDPTSKQ